jgi:Glycosyltransferase 61
MNDSNATETRPRAAAIRTVPDAMVLFSGRERVATVVDAAGMPVAEGNAQRLGLDLAYADFVDRSADIRCAHLAGRYLYGGTYWSHFGHFLFESTARLWAWPGLKDELDGIVFVSPRGSGVQHRQDSFRHDLLEFLSVSAPVIVLDHTTSLSKLHIPAPGCGLGALASGTPEFRDFVHTRLAQIAPRKDAPKIYISRSSYGLRRGGMLAEAHLEAALAADGYLIYQPELETLEAQIATYRGAEKIIAPDSSALHLFGFVGTAAQQVAIVLRRHDGAIDIAPQITAFTGRAPLVLNCIRQMKYRTAARTAAWAQIAEVDFAALGKALSAGGFLSSDTALRGLRWREVQRAWVVAGKHLKGELSETLLTRGDRRSIGLKDVKAEAVPIPDSG